MASTQPAAAPSPVARMDRTLALGFGAVVLLLMLVAAGTAGWLYARLNHQEEDRLAGTIARILEQSINKVSFSGKYHTRLLLEEMQDRTPELDYISVESEDGIIIAHSDPARNGTTGDDAPTPTAGDGLLVRDRMIGGRSIKEVILPYHGGTDGQTHGRIRIGLDVEPARHEHQRNQLVLLVLVALLTAAAMWAVLLLSRRFGGAMRALAVQLQGIADSLPGVIYRFHLAVDGSVRMVFASQAASRLFGPSPAGPQGFLTGLLAGLEPPEQTRFHCSLRDAADARTPWSFAARFTRQDGGQVWFHCTAQTVRLDDGSSEFSGVLLDISERQQAVEELHRSRNMLAHVMNSVPHAIFWKSPDGRYLGCNETFARIAGLASTADIVGKTDFDLSWPREEAEQYRRDDLRVIADGTPLWHIIETVQRKAGGQMWVDTSKVPLTDEQGRIYGVLGVFADITERKLAEEEKARLQAQLAQAQKMESVGRLAGGVAHDFNNMLQAILGYAYLIERDLPAGSRQCDNLRQIQVAAQHSADLTRQLLAFARKQSISPRVLDLNETIAAMLKMLQRLLGENIRLTWSPKAGLWPVRMDPTQVDQILANLTINARDAIHGTGSIRIETANQERDSAFLHQHPDAKAEGYVVLTVGDDGCGMDRQVLAHIFEPFFTTKEQGKGTGLGLATVFGIVQQNDGFIDVQSEPGRGTTFLIYLPRSDETAADAATTSAPVGNPRGHETVLVVEDDQRILTVASAVLKEHGYAVLAASSPDEALALVQGHTKPIQLLITDVIMPGMNGLQLYRRLAGLQPGMRCICMSGYTANVMTSQGVPSEGIEFLQKPFRLDQLLATVRRVLDAGEGRTAMALR